VQILPDILAPGISVVFAAPAIGECAARRGHYYAGPNNAFWQLLHEIGLTPRPLTSAEDSTVLTYGIGLADVVKDFDAPEPCFDVVTFIARMERCAPRWMAFNGKQVGQAVARRLGHKPSGLGAVHWTIAGSEVFVLPSSSGANRRREYDGRATRLQWWQEFADYVR
jgi:double-stranded uracil-DNA glycosylase